MKKIMYIAAALLVLVGCNKNSQENRENAPANYGTITGKIVLPQGEDAKAGARKITAPDDWKTLSEAFKMQWESTDKIYIYNGSQCKELTVKSIDAQTGNATFEGVLLDDMSNYTVAYGYDPTAGATAFAVDYIANNYRPFADGTGEYSIFTIDNFGPVMGLKLQGTAKVGKIEVIASKSSATQATYTMTFGTAIELNATTPTVVYFPLNDLGDADKLEAKFYQGSSVLKTQVFTTLPAKNIVTTYPAIEVNDPYNGHAYVDLGLPSGLKWATMNVGATAPEGYGNYFAWGEMAPHQDNDYSSSKYTYTDNPTTLPLDHDAARVNWGGNWRMPTKAEQDELRTECTWTWCDGETTKYNNTTVKGYLVTSKAEGNTNSIFLPAAGGYYNSSLESDGQCGEYWSSSLDEGYSYHAYYLFFIFMDYMGMGDVDGISDHRYFGRSVRPVVD